MRCCLQCVVVFQTGPRTTISNTIAQNDSHGTPLLNPPLCPRAPFVTHLLAPVESDIVAEDPPIAVPSDASESAPAALPDDHVAESTATVQDGPTNPTEATTVEAVAPVVEPVETAAVVETVETVVADETEAALAVDLDPEVVVAVVTEEEEAAHAGEWSAMFCYVWSLADSPERARVGGAACVACCCCCAKAWGNS